MLTIWTRFFGQTNTKPARIVATTPNGHRATISYDYENAQACHIRAAKALIKKIDDEHRKKYNAPSPWTKTVWRMGDFNKGYIHVNANDTGWVYTD